MYTRQHRADLQVSYLSDVSRWSDAEADQVLYAQAGLQQKRDYKAGKARRARLEQSRKKAERKKERVTAATIRRQALNDLEKVQREEKVSKWMGKTGMQAPFLNGCGSDAYIKSTHKRLKKVVVQKDCSGTYEAVHIRRRRRSRDDGSDSQQDQQHLLASASEADLRAATGGRFSFSPMKSSGLSKSQSWHSANGSQRSAQRSKASGHSAESFFVKNLKNRRERAGVQAQSEQAAEMAMYGPRRYPNKDKSSTLRVTRSGAPLANHTQASDLLHKPPIPVRKYVPTNLASMSTDEVNHFIDAEERHAAKRKADDIAQRTLRRYAAAEKDFDEVGDVARFERRMAAKRFSDTLANAVVVAKQAARLADAKATVAQISSKRALMHQNEQAELALRQRSRPIVMKISPPPSVIQPPKPCYYGKDGRRHTMLFDHGVSVFKT